PPDLSFSPLRPPPPPRLPLFPYTTLFRSTRSSPRTAKAASTTCSSPPTASDRGPAKGRAMTHAAAETFRAGPSGIGTSAARIFTRFARDPGYAEMPWGDGTASPLYCPVVERVNDPLAEEVNRRLVVWAEECGFTGEGLDQITGAGFGRLAMLTHPDTDDPDALLVAAQLNAAWWAADDYYPDDRSHGPTATEPPP